MTSKEAPSGKRAALPRATDCTKAFVKDWTRLTHYGRYDMQRLKQAMLLLVSRDEPLGPEWLDRRHMRPASTHERPARGWPGRLAGKFRCRRST